MKDRIHAIVMSSLKELNDTLEKQVSIDTTEDIYLYGQKGALDSLAFVTLIVAIEEKLEAEEHVNLTLANDKAFAQKNNPFRTVLSLVDYISMLIKEESLCLSQ